MGVGLGGDLVTIPVLQNHRTHSKFNIVSSTFSNFKPSQNFCCRLRVWYFKLDRSIMYLTFKKKKEQTHHLGRWWTIHENDGRRTDSQRQCWDLTLMWGFKTFLNLILWFYVHILLKAWKRLFFWLQLFWLPVVEKCYLVA